MLNNRFTLASFSVMLLLLLSLLIRVQSLIYNDGSPEDTIYERFGPRADRLLIKLYNNETAEWEALAKGEIDLADWSLTRTHYNLFTSVATNPTTGLPYNDTLNTVNYGAEFNYFILDINNNKNEFLGNPPDPGYPNPVYPNPTSIKEMRQAIAHLVNRTVLDTVVGEGFYVPIYTVVPPCQGGFNHPGIKPGGALEDRSYPFSRAEAEALLDSGGFPINASTGWRFWDLNSNGIEESNEYLELKFYIRNDHVHRRDLGTFLADELNATNIRVNRILASSGTCFIEVMVNKDFHLYTGGWSVGVEPEHLILYCWDYYWHPGYCYNIAGIHDPEFCNAVYEMLYADTIEETITSARLAQVIFAENAYSVPLWSYAGSKAMSRFYTGGNTWQNATPDDGENQYRGQYWEGAVGMSAQSGIDNFWSFLNMHPQGNKRGDGENMTIRWGFKEPKIYMLNPIYSSWWWDWQVLNLIYEPLLKRDPQDTSRFIPWLVEEFKTGVYDHPIQGNCTKVRYTLRSDVTWHDGTPLTVADVYFTLIELRQILRDRGIPPPWWCEFWTPVNMRILDSYNFEILLDAKNIWEAGWVSSNIILPKHIWKPIAETGDPYSFAPDPNMIGSGPWRLKDYTENSHILLMANNPGDIVQTDLPGSTQITSESGYHRYLPIEARVSLNGSTEVKVDYYNDYILNYSIHSLCFREPVTVDISITYPDGTSNEISDEVIPIGGNWTHAWTGEIKGKKETNITVYITSPLELTGTYNWSRIFWGTIKEDLAGSTYYDDIGLETYPYKDQLPSPDCKVDIKDVAPVAKAFGSYPGHERWNPLVDIHEDYKIDIKDIGLVAIHFGEEYS